MKDKKKLIIAVAVVILVVILIISLTGKKNEKVDPVNVEDPQSEEISYIKAKEQTEIKEPDYSPNGAVQNKELIYIPHKFMSDKPDKERTVRIGLNKNPDGEYLYLNLRCDAAKVGDEIGFYVFSSQGMVESSNSDMVWDIGEGPNKGVVNYFIPSRFYNEVCCSEYKDDENYGIRWSCSHSLDRENPVTPISVRMVRLKTNEILDIFHIDVSYDYETGVFTFADVHSGDASKMGLITDETRNELIEKAIDFVPYVISDLRDDWEKLLRGASIIERVSNNYFPQIIGINKTTDKVYNYSFTERYAMTIPLSYEGFITIYFGPAKRLEGQITPHNELQKSGNYWIYSYDALNPRSAERIQAPEHFWER